MQNDCERFDSTDCDRTINTNGDFKAVLILEVVTERVLRSSHDSGWQLRQRVHEKQRDAAGMKQPQCTMAASASTARIATARSIQMASSGRC